MSVIQRQALIVEGGGMRGAFTAGVLDAFLEQQFNPFDLYVGVSSGSTNLANYLAGQKGRTLNFYIDHSLRPEFISYKRFLKGGDLLDLEWMWQVGETEHPLDQQTLFAQNPDFYMVLTHAQSGQAEYLRAGRDNLLDALRASSTIPVLTRQPVDIMGEPYFDGGVADALPVQWAAQQADVSKLMVIRTRPQHYFKASSKGDQFLAKYIVRNNQGFALSLKQRCHRYNDSVNFLRQPLSTQQPQHILEVCVPDKKGLANRLCKDRNKLQYTYQVGLETGFAAIEQWKTLP
ncbi:MAG TPA: patatin family protein [Acinetobacter ursingii]|uniref:patatin-like phospholipase family protein n=1 Tax=Acinetobacter ursingii TaxID=108980 RepID=UPI000EDC0577|nr:patatin family protein [Acinetobacter ursingii]MCH2005481.1 patatin family protein [Acinetobacter ursingii]MCU4305715.1 patatin family protein [Acinetobacter ursingii]MCU4371546.1 patatin family protein [Acinetobacter ursingii]MCU4381614.1 patatin family protein [Acinetobacter ursingii]MCU4608373.1 patatin family protein [Acinetobacter ursingii]